MCVTNVYTDRYPDGKEVEFRQTSYCQHGTPLNRQTCVKHTTVENPARKIQFGEPTTEYMLTAHQNDSSRPPRSSSTEAQYRFKGDESDSEGGRQTARFSQRDPLRPRRQSKEGRVPVYLDSPPIPKAPEIQPQDAISEKSIPIIVDERPLRRVDSKGVVNDQRLKPQTVDPTSLVSTHTTTTSDSSQTRPETYEIMPIDEFNTPFNKASRIPCKVIGCKRDYARRADMQRHVKEHHEGAYFCPEPNCPWPGAIHKSRFDLHRSKEHRDIYRNVDLVVPDYFGSDSPPVSPYLPPHSMLHGRGSTTNLSPFSGENLEYRPESLTRSTTRSVKGSRPKAGNSFASVRPTLDADQEKGKGRSLNEAYNEAERVYGSRQNNLNVDKADFEKALAEANRVEDSEMERDLASARTEGVFGRDSETLDLYIKFDPEVSDNQPQVKNSVDTDYARAIEADLKTRKYDELEKETASKEKARLSSQSSLELGPAAAQSEALQGVPAVEGSGSLRKSIISCNECQRRKQKCNGANPCNNCGRRYPQVACTYRYDRGLDVALRFLKQPSAYNGQPSRGRIVGQLGNDEEGEVDYSEDDPWLEALRQKESPFVSQTSRPGSRTASLLDDPDYLDSLEPGFFINSDNDDEGIRSGLENSNAPTWKDLLEPLIGPRKIAQNIYIDTNSSNQAFTTPNLSAARDHQLHPKNYADTDGEEQQDETVWLWTCHKCGNGGMSIEKGPICNRLNCHHRRCVDCPLKHLKLRGSVEKIYSRGYSAELPTLVETLPAEQGVAGEVHSGNAGKAVFETKKQLYSRSSSAESLQSLVDSIFSIASLSSASTVAETNNALQRVLAILKSDAALKVLYADSVSKTSADKFNRNLGILLKRFAVDLEKEAKCWNEQRAAQFIRGRARAIAQKVATSVYPSQRESQTLHPQIVDQDKAESSDDSDLEEEPDEFVELEIFVTSSTAFRKLRDNISGFLGLEPSQEEAGLEASSCKLLAELPFAEEDYVDMLIAPVIEEQLPAPYSQGAWRRPSFSQKIRDFLFPESPLADGLSRVRWQCACGETLYDDYRELKPGAAKRMEHYLRRCSYKNCAGDSKSMTERGLNIGRSLKGIISSLGQRLQTLKSGERPALVNTELRYYSDARATRTPAHTSGEVFYLLLCHNSGIGAEVVKLRQPDICDINNDHKLFSFLHEEYITLRKRWWTWISLWTLQSIKFVRFELYENELVDVKKVDEVPPPTKDNEYRHGPPNPPELNPPLGPTLLMHLFKHPEKAGTKKHCLKKIPRKLRNRLAVIDEEEDAIGWGLQFVEGWSKKRLMYMTALTFGLSSFVVMVLVSILGHDVQNAGAIASFMLSFVTIGIATAQAALHMS